MSEDRTPLDIVNVRNLLPKSTSSDVTFEIAREWFQQCLSSHTRCQSRVNNLHVRSQMPTRLLDLSDNKVILRERATVQHYACLSHCWGSGASILKTTLATKQGFQKQIPWDSLPTTFTDAIDVCRKLGLDYLWIDSLCIIQDCNEDVSSEI